MLKHETLKYHQNATRCIQEMLKDSNHLILEDEYCPKGHRPVYCMGDLFQSRPSHYQCLHNGNLFSNGLIACWPSTVSKTKIFKSGAKGLYLKKGTLLGPYPGKIYPPNHDQDDMYTFGVVINEQEYNLTPNNPQQTFLPLINSISFDPFDSCQCRFEKFLHKVLAPLNKDFCFYIPSSELNIEPISIDGIIFYKIIKPIQLGDELVSNYKQQYLAGLTEKIIFPRWRQKLVKHKLLYYRIILEWYRLHYYANTAPREIQKEYLDKINQATRAIIKLTKNKL